jgi:hypothetical protein
VTVSTPSVPSVPTVTVSTPPSPSGSPPSSTGVSLPHVSIGVG